MNGYKFYLEYPNNAEKRKGTRKILGNHSGTVVAVLQTTKEFKHWWISSATNDIMNEAFTSVFDNPDSPVCSSSVSENYLITYCKRISEDQARKIHPNLFVRLDD